MKIGALLRNQLSAPHGVTYTAENISFQLNDSFGPALESVLQKYKDLVDQGTGVRGIHAAKDLHAEVQKLVFDRFGIKIKLITNEHLAATMPNVYVSHNPMVQDRIRDLYEAYPEVGGQDAIKALPNFRELGTINQGTVKATGWFSEQEVPLWMSFAHLFGQMKLSVKEVTAIVLHELGHVWEGVVFSANINTTNQILADVARHIQKDNRDKDAKYVYQRVRQVNPKMTMDIAQGLCSDNRVVMNVALFRMVSGMSESLMANHVYDRTSFEALADQFASRFGYGQYLISGLNTMWGDDGEYQMYKTIYESSLGAMVICAIATIGGLCMVAAGGAGAVVGAILSLLFSFLFKCFFDSTRVSTKDMTYDNIKQRFQRIRNQMVELLKDKEIPAATRKAVLEQIIAADDLIDQKDVFEGGIERITAKIFPSDRNAKASIQFQQEVEALVANDLFVKSAALKLA